MKYSIFLWILLPLAVIISSCSSDQNSEKSQSDRAMPEPTGKTFVYDCLEEWNIPVKIDSTRAWVFLRDTTVFLEQVRAASGARYESEDGDYMFWSKGDEAIIEAAARSIGYCSINREEAAWQEARLQGATFRATGFEPGWHLEIFPDSISYVLDYGKRSFSTPVSDPKADPQQGETIYQVEGDTHSGQIRIVDEECTAPSGKEFPNTVFLTMDGDEYRGCGKMLHGPAGI